MIRAGRMPIWACDAIGNHHVTHILLSQSHSTVDQNVAAPIKKIAAGFGTFLAQTRRPLNTANLHKMRVASGGVKRSSFTTSKGQRDCNSSAGKERFPTASLQQTIYKQGRNWWVPVRGHYREHGRSHKRLHWRTNPSHAQVSWCKSVASHPKYTQITALMKLIKWINPRPRRRVNTDWLAWRVACGFWLVILPGW